MKRLVLALAAAALALGAGASTASAETIHEAKPMGWHMQTGLPHGLPVGIRAAAYLTRSDDAIYWAIRTHGLEPGYAYTVWVVVVDNPGACASTPCSAADLILNPEVDAQVRFGDGDIVGADGRVSFHGWLPRGPVSGWLPNRSFDDPLGAEVHFVLNSHGPVLAAYMPEQILTYRAACTDASLPAIFPATAKADGTPGPNRCRLTQFAVFL